jgi:hypothetical protein
MTESNLAYWSCTGHDDQFEPWKTADICNELIIHKIQENDGLYKIFKNGFKKLEIKHDFKEVMEFRVNLHKD